MIPVLIAPLFSVIIPNYNHVLYLKQRIDSVLNQTYQDFELIILDDCSTDNSKEIIEQYRSHLKVTQIVYNTENSGSTFKQWDKGINLAKGEYIWIAESDDWCEPTFIENLLLGLETSPNVVLAYAQSYIVEGKNVCLSNHNYLQENINGNVFIRQYMLNGNAVFNASMAIFRKSIYSKIDKQYINFKYCGDWLFWSEVAVCGDVFISGKVLNYFRQHSQSVYARARNTGFDLIEELEVLDIFYKKGYIEKTDFDSAISIKYLNFLEKEKYLLPRRKVEIQSFFSSHIKRGKMNVIKIKTCIKEIIKRGLKAMK